MRSGRAYQDMEIEAPPLYGEPERWGSQALAILVAVPLALAGAYTTILLLV
jgi:uncharacterized membrane protein